MTGSSGDVDNEEVVGITRDRARNRPTPEHKTEEMALREENIIYIGSMTNTAHWVRVKIRIRVRIE